jgi:hypothetical protein
VLDLGIDRTSVRSICPRPAGARSFDFGCHVTLQLDYVNCESEQPAGAAGE